MPGTPVPYRRLDTLARLLEGNSICSAIAVHNGRLLVATNEIHGTSTGTSKLFKFIDSTLTYFSKVVKESQADGPKATSQEDLQVLLRICSESATAHGVKPTTVASEAVNVYISRMLSGGTDSLRSFQDIEKAIQDIKIPEVMREFGRDGGMQMMQVLSLVYDRSRDFYKLKDDLQRKNPECEGLRLALVDYNHASILREGKQNVHAEMRIIDHVLKAEPAPTDPKKIDEVYVGISKLCCAHCYAAVKVVAKITAVSEEFGDDEKQALEHAEGEHQASQRVAAPKMAVRADDGSSSEESTGTEGLKPIPRLFAIRGTHALRFGKWEEPGFLERYRTEYQAILDSIGARADPHGMRPSVSVSQPAGVTQSPAPALPLIQDAEVMLSKVETQKLIVELEERAKSGIDIEDMTRRLPHVLEQCQAIAMGGSAVHAEGSMDIDGGTPSALSLPAPAVPSRADEALKGSDLVGRVVKRLRTGESTTDVAADALAARLVPEGASAVRRSSPPPHTPVSQRGGRGGAGRGSG